MMKADWRNGLDEDEVYVFNYFHRICRIVFGAFVPIIILLTYFIADNWENFAVRLLLIALLGFACGAYWAFVIRVTPKI